GGGAVEMVVCCLVVGPVDVGRLGGVGVWELVADARLETLMQQIVAFSRCTSLADEELVSFFFTNRRRHTRSLRDWSSDVCSSDLPESGLSRNPNCAPTGRAVGAVPSTNSTSMMRRRGAKRHESLVVIRPESRQKLLGWELTKIGRASCRAMVEVSMT